MNLLAGEDGINDAGLSLSRTLPAPKNIFLEGTAQVFRGDTPGLFQAARRSDISTVGHLRAFRDITESTNLDLGFSYARGHSPLADGANQVYGVDATLRWKPLRRAIYNSFIARSEFVWGRAEAAPILTGSPLPPALLKPFGYYISTDYQLARRWFLGGRFDRSDRLLSPQRDRHGRFHPLDLPSQRVRPDSRPAPPHRVRGRPHRQRTVVPDPVRHRRAWGACVLISGRVKT